MASKTFDFSTNTYNFNSVTTTVNGVQLSPFLKGMSYGDGLDKKGVFGGQATPVGVVRGPYQPKCSLEFLTRESFNDFTKAMGPYWLEKVFNITHSYSEPGKKTITDTIQQVTITQEGLDGSGTDAIAVKLDILVLGKIKWDGVESIY